MSDIRRFGGSAVLPAPVGAVNDSGFSEGNAFVDHAHEWASQWVDLTPQGSFLNASNELKIQICKIGNLVQLRGAVYSTSNDSTITTIPAAFLMGSAFLPTRFIGFGNGATSFAMLLEMSAAGVLTIVNSHTTINYCSLTAVRYVLK